jgi:FtsP/CotA-like multicopper oxidase with cupredoxin domain
MVTRLWLRHGRYSFAVLAALLGLAAFTAWRLSRPVMALGDPYNVPLVVDTNPDPDVVETTIVAEESTVEIAGGVTANVQTFNGAVPGPEFRLKVGDTVIVHFENHLEHPTGIHWHGIELSNASDGTPLVQNQVPPDGTFLYKFQVTRPGIYWYHPHHHASTNQVFKGLYGSIVVADPHEAALQAMGVLPPSTQTKTLALSDITVCKDAGSNDTATYDPSLPWVGGGPLPVQPPPTPFTLCEGSPIDEDGNARGPFAAGDVPNIQKLGTAGRTNEGQTVITNGINVGGRAGSPSAPGALDAGASALDVLAGQGLRLRIGNTATTRFFRLILTDDTGAQVPLVRIGGQGGLLDHAVVEGGVVAGFDFKYESGEVLLDPGDRADVVVAIPSSATGVLTLWTQDFERTGTGFSLVPTVPVMHLNVVGTASAPYSIGAGTPLRALIPGAAVETLGPATGTLLDPAAFSPAKPGLPSQDVKLTATGSSLGVDSVLGEHDFPGDYTAVPHPGSTRYAKLHDTLELTVTNTTGAHHPFHLHGFSIQPLELTKPASPSYTFGYREFRDNIDVPAGYSLRFRVRLDDRPLMDGTTLGGGTGRWVFHCHIFFHATFGMISEFVVVAPDGNERPNVNADATSVTRDEGQTATVHGTYVDPDGDAVTLTASLGTVADNADGTWTWTHDTTDGPDESQFVYVTATDGSGLSSQAVFRLEVNNLPPSVSIASPVAGQVPLALPVAVTAPFTDPGSGDTHTCSIDFGDGTIVPGTVLEGGGSGVCTGSHLYSSGGTRTIMVSLADDDGGGDFASVTIFLNTPPTLHLPGPKWKDYHESLVFFIHATDPNAADTITLSASGLPAGLVFTDFGNRTGKVGGLITAVPGDYVVTFSADDHVNPPVTGTVIIHVTKQETETKYIGPKVIAKGLSVTLQARLKEDFGPIAGRAVELKLGSQACTGTTNAAGIAACSFVVNSSLGWVPLRATFDGDAYYKPSSDHETALVFAFLHKGGFAIGDRNDEHGSRVTFWGKHWHDRNRLSGGRAAEDFRGFIPKLGSPPECGDHWRIDQPRGGHRSWSHGDDDDPPNGVPRFMGTIVSSSIREEHHGDDILGNTVKIVVVETDPGYRPGKHDSGTGKVVGTYCY